MIGYATGFQIWDCSDLASISEVLNLSGKQWSGIDLVQYLPPPGGLLDEDLLGSQRPLLGILSVSSLIVYLVPLSHSFQTFRR